MVIIFNNILLLYILVLTPHSSGGLTHAPDQWWLVRGAALSKIILQTQKMTLNMRKKKLKFFLQQNFLKVV
jgi:hypothetical protein